MSTFKVPLSTYLKINDKISKNRKVEAHVNSHTTIVLSECEIVKRQFDFRGDIIDYDAVRGKTVYGSILECSIMDSFIIMGISFLKEKPDLCFEVE